MRQRRIDEIVPAGVRISGGTKSDDNLNPASHAIDLNLSTMARVAERDSDRKYWLKVKLDRVYCVEKVMYLQTDSSLDLTWTCTRADCSTCYEEEQEWGVCKHFSLTVYEEKVPGEKYALVSDCKLGDTVKLERIHPPGRFNVNEIAIFGKQGKITKVIGSAIVKFHS